MDIQAMSMNSSQNSLLSQVDVTMLSKGLKAQEQQAADLLKGLPSAAPLAEGTGQRIDLFA